MKNLSKFIFVIMLIIPFIVSAEELEEEVVAQSIKYIKTVTVYNNSDVMRNAGFGEITSLTTEVTKEEFDNAPSTTSDVDELSPRGSIQTETTYKRLTTTVTKVATYYQYAVNLYWKNIPKVRSNDIIGIGYYNDVELLSSPNIIFNQDYCRSANNCYISVSGTEVVQEYGTAVIFKVPADNLISLEQTLSFYVKKAVSWTITEQVAAGDYAHATSSITQSKAASNLIINSLGLAPQHEIEDYYDTTPSARAHWIGTW